MIKKLGLYVIIGIVVLGISLYIYNKVSPEDYSHKVVVCIPVYGQSYALGEEATRITDFDSLKMKYGGRIVTENLDCLFGFYDSNSQFKQWVKKIVQYDKKAYELSVYGMAEKLVSELGNDTIICIFPGGAGMSTISQLMKPSSPYNKFVNEHLIEREEHKCNGGRAPYIIPNHTGIGTIFKVKCPICGEEKDITDSEAW